jgi:hypothetical protein
VAEIEGTPEWSLLLDKSKENLEVAGILEKKGSYGLAAYHAQQSIETLFKGYVYKTLSKHPEYATIRLKTHLPLKKVLEHIAEFVDKIERKVKAKQKKLPRSEQSQELKALVLRYSSMKSMFLEIKDFLDYLDSKEGHSLKLDLWRYSMDLEHQSARIVAMIKIANEAGSDHTQESFMEEMIFAAQVVFANIDRFNYRRIDKDYFKEIKPFMLRFLVDRNFPPVALSRMLDGKTLDLADRADMRDFVISRGGYEAVEMFFGQGGLLNKIVKIAMKYYPDTYRETEKVFDLQSLVYASSICTSMILLYAHETFGRYPQSMKEGTTETIYSDKASKIAKYIGDCRKAQEKIHALI